MAGYGYPEQNSNFGGMGGGIGPEIQGLFARVDLDRSGKISPKELQGALAAGQGRQFSDTACRLMVGMFDRDGSQTIDINEFDSLYKYINQWLGVFRMYDKDQSGFIDQSELSQALQTMGFRFSEDFVKFVMSKNDIQNRENMSVDQFIVVCVQIQRFTEAFRSRDHQQQGSITINFEDFLKVLLELFI